MRALFAQILSEAGVKTKELAGVEYHVRVAEDKTYEFYLNYTTEEQYLTNVNGTELLSGQGLDGELVMEPGAVAVVEKQIGE